MVFKVVGLIAQRPFLSLFLFSAIPMILSGVAMPKFTLEDLQGWDVSLSTSSRSYDAYTIAIGNWRSVVASAIVVNSTQERVVLSEEYLDVYFLPESGLTIDFGAPSVLQAIKDLEDQVFASPEMQRTCLLTMSGACAPAISVTNYANLSDFNRSEFVENLKQNKENVAFSLPSDFDFASADENTVLSKTRTRFQVGLPRQGFSSVQDRSSEQSAEIQSDIETIVETIFTRNSLIPDVLTLYDFEDIDGYVAFKTLIKDAAFAGGSLVWVGFFIGVHTRSLFMSVLGMSQILLSFPTAYFFYRIVLGIPHFGSLQVLAIYVILGIGADDIFVFWDAYRQAKIILPYNATQAERLQWAYRKAVVAMLLTSFTTCAAFVVTALSPILNIRVFGIFAGMLVVINYLLCITILPCLIIIHENHVSRYPVCLCWCCCPGPFREIRAKFFGDEKDVKEVTGLDVKDDINTVEHYEFGPVELFYRDKLAPKVLQYKHFIIGVALVVGGVFGYFTSTLGPSDKVIEDIFPDDHPLTIVRDAQEIDFSRGTSSLVNIELVFGVNPMDRSTASKFDPRIKGEFSYSDVFDLGKNHTQLALLELCDGIDANLTSLYRPGGLECWVREWETWSNGSFPYENETEAYAQLAAFLASPEGIPFSDTDVFFNPNTGKPDFIQFTVILDVKITDRLDLILKAIRDLDEYVRNNADLDVLGEHLLFSFSYIWWETQEALVRSSTIGLSTGVSLAFVVLLIATRSPIVSLLAMVTIGVIVVCVAGSMAMLGWDLGFMEAVCLTVLVGLAVDYVVHIAIAYIEFEDHDVVAVLNLPDDASLASTREHRTVVAMTRLGVSVFAGACTTFGAAIFLLLCTIQYLGQFGVFLALLILYALINSNLLLPSLLATFGPSSSHL